MADRKQQSTAHASQRKHPYKIHQHIHACTGLCERASVRLQEKQDEKNFEHRQEGTEAAPTPDALVPTFNVNHATRFPWPEQQGEVYAHIKQQHLPPPKTKGAGRIKPEQLHIWISQHQQQKGELSSPDR